VSDIPERLARVRDRIANAARRVRRDPDSVRLVAISKTFPAADIRAAAAAGQRDFGENRVQEGLQKIGETADLHLTWHLVGHLQSNKARKAGASFDVIHSVDDPELLVRLDQAAAEAGRRTELLVQVDMAGEATKHGARPEDLRAIFDAGRGCAAARVRGLMLLPPAVASPEEARPFFTALRRLRDELVAQGVGEGMLSELSMGMSHDFEIAVEEGATMVRVGSAIFGVR
jgi:pyridoxal phosphate enzyme (YggS family)